MAQMLGTQRAAPQLIGNPLIDDRGTDSPSVDGRQDESQASGARLWSAGFASLTGLRHARLDLERAGLRALVAAAVAAVVVSGALTWWSRPVVEAPARAPSAPASASP